MRTKKQIEAMIDKVARLRKVIPAHTIFGGDNWQDLDIQKRVLEQCLKLDEGKIKEKLDARVESLEMDGKDWYEDPQVVGYDWVLGNTDDDLADEESIESFTKKKEEMK